VSAAGAEGRLAHLAYDPRFVTGFQIVPELSVVVVGFAKGDHVSTGTLTSRHAVLGEVRTEDARYWAMAPAAVGEVIDALEALTHITDYGPDTILRGRAAMVPSHFLPVAVRRALDTTGGLVVLKLASLAGAGSVLLGRRSRTAQIAGAGLIFSSRWLGDLRNPYGRDGSDQMSGLIAGYRLVTAAVPNAEASDDLFLRAVSAQTFVSYLASGLAKLVGSSWQSGEALDQVLQTRQYGQSPAARLIREHPPLARLLTWFTIAWETGFPVVYLLPPNRARLALTGVKAFHLGIAATMGLPRFFWGFSSAHAAVEYVIAQKRGGHDR